jgi:hypothetical protein
MRPNNDSIAKPVRPFKQEQEKRSYQTRNRANDQRQNSQHEKGTTAAIWVGHSFPLRAHL